MLKYEGIAKVGDRIRAYHFEPFEGRPKYYVEGVVDSIKINSANVKCFRIKCDVDTLWPEQKPDWYDVSMGLLFDWEGRIEVL